MMTEKEHLLMVRMFTKQAQFVKVLANILKSKEIIEGDDAAAFEQATALDIQSNAALFAQSVVAYVKLAKDLGIETDLEKLILPANPQK
jgi:hypothetical protein